MFNNLLLVTFWRKDVTMIVPVGWGVSEMPLLSNNYIYYFFFLLIQIRV